MLEKLKDDEKFDTYVETNYSFHIDNKPVDMAEQCKPSNNFVNQ